MNPMYVRILMLLLAGLVVAVTKGSVTYDQAVDMLSPLLGGALAGAALFRRPGDIPENHAEVYAARRAARRRSTVPPLPLLALPFVLAFVGCSVNGPGVQVNWPKVLQCGPNVSDLVGVVSRVLLADGGSDHATISVRAKSELEALARDYGPGTVACIVDRLVRDWRAPGATMEPNRVAAASRGEDFLRVVGVEKVELRK